jgi:hypothetical protein
MSLFRFSFRYVTMSAKSDRAGLVGDYRRAGCDMFRLVGILYWKLSKISPAGPIQHQLQLPRWSSAGTAGAGPAEMVVLLTLLELDCHRLSSELIRGRPADSGELEAAGWNSEGINRRLTGSMNL